MSLRKARQSRAFENEQSSDPVTPARKPRHSIVLSPLLTPSLSASHPFDWEAAKGHRPPPYPSNAPNGVKGRRSMRMSMGVGTEPLQDDSNETTPGTPVQTSPFKKPRKSRVIIRSTWKQWITSLPSTWWLKISMLHHEIPLPPGKTLGRSIGVFLHVLHGIVKWSEIYQKQQEDDGWGGLNVRSIYADEEDEQQWFHWRTILTGCLILAALYNTYALFKESTPYDFHLRDEHNSDQLTYSSPNLIYVRSPTNKGEYEEDEVEYSYWSYIWYFIKFIFRSIWRMTTFFWRFLVYHPASIKPVPVADQHYILRLVMWTPEDHQLTLFETYSPLHSILWLLVQAGNWKLVCFVMVMTTAQLRGLIGAYTVLAKDQRIKDAEVMYEYNMKFVNPQINRPKKDACVMTHESEMVHYSGHVGRTPHHRY
ncbi:hypothetical protein CPB86DRAFT_787620, partial [Serendipita vermifera]